MCALSVKSCFPTDGKTTDVSGFYIRGNILVVALPLYVLLFTVYYPCSRDCLRKNHCVAQLAADVVAGFVDERSFERITTLGRNDRAAHIVFVAANLDPFGPELLKGKGCDGCCGFGDIPISSKFRACPIADLKFGDVPVDAMEAAAANKRGSSFEIKTEAQIFSLQELGVGVTDVGLCSFNCLFTDGPGHPGDEFWLGVNNGLANFFAIAGHGAANGEPLAVKTVGKVE